MVKGISAIFLKKKTIPIIYYRCRVFRKPTHYKTEPSRTGEGDIFKPFLSIRPPPHPPLSLSLRPSPLLLLLHLSHTLPWLSCVPSVNGGPVVALSLRQIRPGVEASVHSEVWRRRCPPPYPAGRGGVGPVRGAAVPFARSGREESATTRQRPPLC